MARSNSANAPTICIIMRPAGDGGKIHRPQDAVGHIRWAGDLQEVTAAATGR
jgi:hypothetical protein